MTDKTQAEAHSCINPQCNPTKCWDCACAIPANDQTGHVVLDLLNTFAVNDLGHPFEDGDSVAVDRARQWLQNRSTTLQAAPEAPAALAVPAELELPDVEDMAHSAVQEALSVGVNHDVFHRWMRAVMDKTVQAIAAAPAQEHATQLAGIPKLATPEMRAEFRAAYKEGGFWNDRLDYALDKMLAAAPAQAQEDAPIVWPKSRDVGRIGDMSTTASLRVGLDGDNDSYVNVWDENGGGSIEFCTPGAGGGKSRRTRVALLALMVAMEADNAEDPRRDWWAARAVQGSA